MSRIEAVEAAVARVPMDRPTSFSSRVVRDREYGLVRVRDTDGVTGIGFCYPGHKAASIVATAVRDLLAPVAVGQDSMAVEKIWADMYQEALLHGRAGAVMRAISIIDVAIWDLNARRLNAPLSHVLGCHKPDLVPCYASGGYYTDGKTPGHLADEVRGYVEAGFKAVKIKVGKEDPKGEEARVRACREAIGPDVPLMLDANNAWANVAGALRYVERFEDYEPFWIEEPFGPDDVISHARLARETTIPVATGEILAGRWRHVDFLREEAVHYLQTDAAVCGGITEWRRIAHTAESFSVPVYPHWFHDLHVHLVAASPGAEMVEFFPDDQVLNFRRLIDTQLDVRNGDLVVPDGAGLGFDFDRAALDKYMIGGWS